MAAQADIRHSHAAANGPAGYQRRQPEETLLYQIVLAHWQQFLADIEAEVAGLNVHANTSARARDRKRLEILVKYLARPPIAHDRLSKLPDGRLALQFKQPWGLADVRCSCQTISF